MTARAETQPGEEHLHLFEVVFGAFVQDDKDRSACGRA
jgi:hypothetical protein